MKKRLYTAGPVTVPQSIQDKLSQPILYHRDKEFLDIFSDVLSGMKYIFQTENDVLPFTASGTGGMEATVLNLLSPGDRVVVFDQGKFSARWSEICLCHGLQVEQINLEWGKSIDLDRLKTTVQKIPDLKAVLLNQCETSTGALNDIRSAAEIVHHRSKALVIVDVISTIGIIPFKMDEWNIDVAIAASNKGLENPPGLIFISLNENAWNSVRNAKLSTYYFNFLRAKQAIEKGTGSAFTPAISLYYGVQQEIADIRQQGIKKIWDDHRKLAAVFRNSIEYLGLKILPPNSSDSVTVIEIPANFSANKLVSEIKSKYGFRLSKGQGVLNDRVIRVGHLSRVNPHADAELIAALETVLRSSGMALAHSNSRDYFLKHTTI